jgi:hypothetical protein
MAPRAHADTNMDKSGRGIFISTARLISTERPINAERLPLPFQSLTKSLPQFAATVAGVPMAPETLSASFARVPNAT